MLAKERIAARRATLDVPKMQTITDQLRRRSQSVDRAGKFCHENWDLMRRSGLLGVVVPEKYGGAGAKPSV